MPFRVLNLAEAAEYLHLPVPALEELARCDFPLVMERLHGLYNSIVPA